MIIFFFHSWIWRSSNHCKAIFGVLHKTSGNQQNRLHNISISCVSWWRQRETGKKLAYVDRSAASVQMLAKTLGTSETNFPQKTFPRRRYHLRTYVWMFRFGRTCYRSSCVCGSSSSSLLRLHSVVQTRWRILTEILTLLYSIKGKKSDIYSVLCL